jgi:hypothetical protein
MRVHFSLCAAALVALLATLLPMQAHALPWPQCIEWEQQADGLSYGCTAALGVECSNLYSLQVAQNKCANEVLCIGVSSQNIAGVRYFRMSDDATLTTIAASPVIQSYFQKNSSACTVSPLAPLLCTFAVFKLVCPLIQSNDVVLRNNALWCWRTRIAHATKVVCN